MAPRLNGKGSDDPGKGNTLRKKEEHNQKILLWEKTIQMETGKGCQISGLKATTVPCAEEKHRQDSGKKVNETWTWSLPCPRCVDCRLIKVGFRLRRQAGGDSAHGR